VKAARDSADGSNPNLAILKIFSGDVPKVPTLELCGPERAADLLVTFKGSVEAKTV
jgi:hypothetical protein